MTIQSADLKLITEFRDFCASKGNEPIQHRDGWGHANWNTCAVGQFAKFKDIPNIDGDRMAGMLKSAFNIIQNTPYGFMIDLGSGDSAEEQYPTYDKVADAVTTIINKFQGVV